jgi:N6-L-threonylcarbamoyladenine synthase
MIVLGIETSCDETGAAFVRDGTEILSNALVTQIELHRKYGGVVPELAARQHAESLDLVLDEAVEKAGIELSSIDGIAVTYGPGLPGALLVGVSFAKGLAYSLSKPVIPVNHLEAHLEAVKLHPGDPVTYPALGMVVSGGHTSLFYIEKPGSYALIGKTRDDAAGEAFDKAAKLLDLGYPGGPVIDKLYASGNPKRFRFAKPRFTDGSADFSFSGLKTAVLKIVRETPPQGRDTDFVKDVAASFQESVVGILISSIENAATAYKTGSVIIAGGVAVNSLLRSRAFEMGERRKMKVFFPDSRLCTDNAAMVASLGCRLLSEGRIAGYDLDAEPDLKLGESVRRADKTFRH